MAVDNYYTGASLPPGCADLIPPKHPITPAAVAAPPAVPPVDGTVTRETILRTATNALPGEKEALAFAEWRHSGAFSEIVDSVIQESGVDETRFGEQLDKWNISIKAIVDELNKKTVADPTPVKPCPELPGACHDPTCQSLFDVNELAIRGRKAVITKRFYFPLIYPDFRVNPGKKWGLGQKVEFDQEWRHEGFTLGGLISSFSLLPNEEVTIEVSAWQRTKSEVEQEKDDATRHALEEELKRTDEQTISNEAASENGWSVSATAAVSYGPISASGTASANGNSTDRLTQAQRHVQESTVHSTSEVSSRRAIKMTHTTESQMEQKSIRRMKNPNQCHTVTFNFFQVIKLIDLQMRLINDAPIFYLPGLFPETLTSGEHVSIPYEVLESFTSPALFLTQYFDIDRDLSQEIHGFALRIRVDVGRAPVTGLRAIAEALVVAAKTLLQVDPGQHTKELGSFLANYGTSAVKLRRNALETYGKDKGTSLQLNTPGVYVDSLLGRCSACEDAITAEKYVDTKRADAERKQIDATNVLIEAEGARRRALLEKGILEPFDSTETPTP
jgi:hypothetical protein